MSVTLKQDNVLWLRGQAAGTSRGSLSEVLDRIVTEARLAGRSELSAIRSVRGTIDLPDDDPDLQQADASVRATFDASIARPVVAREQPRAATPVRKRVKARRA